jgi:hypothetical protein
MSTGKLVLLVTVVTLMALVLATWLGARRQRRDLSVRVGALAREAASVPPRTGADPLGSVPAPVARYLRWAITEHSGMRTVRLHQVGTLRTDPESARWMAFEAEHVAAPRAIGFVWNADVTVMPFVHIRVRDVLLDGEGSGQVSLLSAFPLASDAATPEMNSGSLHRFLGEAVWYPTALLLSAQLRWTAIGANAASATLTDHGTSVSLEFRFADSGEVVGIYTPARWGRFEGGYRQRPWEGHFRRYRIVEGVRVPSEGDVGWYVDDHWQPVWRATIDSFAIDALP